MKGFVKSGNGNQPMTCCLSYKARNIFTLSSSVLKTEYVPFFGMSKFSVTYEFNVVVHKEGQKEII